MTAAYEAKARISVDTSQLASAAREAARNLGTLTTATRELTTALRDMERQGRSAAASLRPFSSMMSKLASDSRQASGAAGGLSSGVRENAQAFNAASDASARFASQQNLTTSAMRTMAREIVDTDRRISELDRAMDMGLNTNGQLDASYTALTQRLRELRQQYDALSTQQREGVRTQMNLLTAQRDASQAARDADAAVREMNKQRMEQVRIAVRAAEQEAKVAAAAERAAEAERQKAAAQQMSNQTAQNTVATSQAVTTAAERVNTSLWAQRSAWEDVAFAMTDVWQVGSQVTRMLWENYSAQEMAIAQISRVSQATATEMQTITAEVRTMSEEIPIAFEELGNIAMLGSQVGVAKDALADFTETVALFSATSEVTADQTATMLARIMQMAGIDDSKVMNLASSVAALGSNSAATDAEILKTVESIATMTTAVGMSAEATVGLGGAMASLVIRPELARGAAQRVFLQLGQAVEGAGAEMERMAEITGLTQEEMTSMMAEDYDQFFLRFAEGLNKMYVNGEQLVPILREIGINNTRDADVVARLAQNYDVLEGSVNRARESFAAGNYLYQESDRIFATLTNRVQLLQNTWNNFLFEAVEAIAPFLIAVVDAATATIQWLNAMNAAPIVGVTAAILGVLGALGLFVSSLARVRTGWLAIQGLWSMHTAQMAANTAAMTTNTAAMAANATATAATGAAATGAAAAQGRLAAAATASAGALRAAMLAHPVGWALGITAGIIGLAAAWDTLGNSAEAAENRLRRNHDAHIQTAGGVDALRTALEADTMAWREVTEAAEHNRQVLGRANAEINEAVRNSNYRIMASMEMSEADQEAADQAEHMARANEWVRDSLGTSKEATDQSTASTTLLAEEMGRYGSEADRAAARVDGVAMASENLITQTDRTTYAVGAATYQMAALSAESALLESGILENAEAFEIFRKSGVDLGRGVALEMQEAGAGAEYFRDVAASIREEFDGWDKTVAFLNEFTSHMIWDGWEPFSTGAIEAANAADYLGENMEAVTLSLEEAARQTELTDQMFIKLPGGARATVEELQAMASEGAEAGAVMQMMETEASALGVTLEQLHTGFTSFFDPLAAWDTALANVNDKLQEQNEAIREQNSGLDSSSLALGEQYTSLLEVEGGFSMYLDELEKSNQAQRDWIANLARLGASGDVPADVIAGLIQMGSEGAEIVEGLANANQEEVNRFVEAWDMGMGSTSELFTTMFADFLTMAVQTGDTAGADFIFELMEEVAAGDITFREAVDEMTKYAEEEFQNADTTNQPMLDNTQALIDLTELIRRVETDTANADAEVEPELETGGFWGALRSFWDNVVEWWGGGPRLNVSPQVSGDYSGSGSYGPLPRKDGGWVSGPGGTRQDKIPALLSDREFVVNARAAREFGPLLEWINSQHGAGSSAIMVPNFVPDNIMRIPRRPIGVPSRMAPDAFAKGAGVRRMSAAERMVFNITNYYPQAEPTSTTVNRALQHGAALNGVL
jgi:TP901 family phage tail tape measure protein